MKDGGKSMYIDVMRERNHNMLLLIKKINGYAVDQLLRIILKYWYVK